MTNAEIYLSPIIKFDWAQLRVSDSDGQERKENERWTWTWTGTN